MSLLAKSGRLGCAVDASCQSSVQLSDDSSVHRLAQVVRERPDNVTPKSLSRAHSLHVRVVSLHKQPLAALGTSEWPPLSSALLAVGVGVQVLDEGDPVLAELRDDGRVDVEVRVGRRSVGAVGTPEGVRVDGVVRAEALGLVLGVEDAVSVVIGRHLVAGQVVLDVADDAVRADVADGVGGLAPLDSGLGEDRLGNVDVEVIQDGQGAVGEGGVLAEEPCVRLLSGVGGLRRGVHGSLVGARTPDRGDLGVLAGLEEVDHAVGEELAIDSGVEPAAG